MINFFGSLCRNFKENTYPKWHFPSHNLSTWIVTKSVKPYFFFIFECTWTYIMIHALNVKQREREDFSFLVNVRKKYFVFFFLLFYMCIYKNIWSNNMDIICCKVYPLIISFNYTCMWHFQSKVEIINHLIALIYAYKIFYLIHASISLSMIFIWHFFYKGRVFCTLITKVLLFSLIKKCFHVFIKCYIMSLKKTPK